MAKHACFRTLLQPLSPSLNPTDDLKEAMLIMRSEGWDLLYNILRANFDGMAEDGYVKGIPKTEKSDGKVEYLYGYRATNIEDRSSGVKVSFQDKDNKTGAIDADFVIAADGPSSTIRGILVPDVKRTYAGYVAWRGTVLETKVSSKTLDCFKEKFVFFHSQGAQILA